MIPSNKTEQTACLEKININCDVAGFKFIMLLQERGTGN
jgi:hypothetical protein